jgi:xylose dehydrogenase (NAD/NADP)
MLGDAIRLGLLGTGRVNHRIVEAAAETDGRVIVSAVASRTVDRARDAAAALSVRSHSSYDALLADSDIDAVYLGLPNALHLPWAVRSIQAGKHVLSEKPLSRDPVAVSDALQLAQQHQVALREGLMHLHHPQTAAVEELVRSGELGELRSIHAEFSFFLDRPNDVRFSRELDGGALLDLGCYCVSYLRLLAGEPDRFCAQATLGDTGVDTGCSATMTAGNVRMSFSVDLQAPRRQELVIVGTEGSARVNSAFHCREPWIEVTVGSDTRRIESAAANPFVLELCAFADAVDAPATPLRLGADPVAQARCLAALVDAAGLYRPSVTHVS